MGRQGLCRFWARAALSGFCLIFGVIAAEEEEEAAAAETGIGDEDDWEDEGNEGKDEEDQINEGCWARETEIVNDRSGETAKAATNWPLDDHKHEDWETKGGV